MSGTCWDGLGSETWRFLSKLQFQSACFLFTVPSFLSHHFTQKTKTNGHPEILGSPVVGISRSFLVVGFFSRHTGTARSSSSLASLASSESSSSMPSMESKKLPGPTWERLLHLWIARKIDMFLSLFVSELYVSWCLDLFHLLSLWKMT